MYVKHLGTGEEAAVRADDSFNSQSVIKIPIMVRAFQLAEQGRLNLDERVTLGRARAPRWIGDLPVRRSGSGPDPSRSHPADDHHQRQHRHRRDDDESGRRRGAQHLAGGVRLPDAADQPRLGVSPQAPGAARSALRGHQRGRDHRVAVRDAEQPAVRALRSRSLPASARSGSRWSAIRPIAAGTPRISGG